MTVTFVSPTPGVMMPSQSAPIVFTTTSDVVPVVSCRFGASARTEERVYRDGAFLYPYEASTRVLNTFTLVRAGGWPLVGAQPEVSVYVYEAQPMVDYVITGSSDRIITGSGDRVVP